MHKWYAALFFIAGLCSSASYASDIFTEASQLRAALSRGDIEELRKRDKTGDMMAPWLIDVSISDDAAREFIGDGARSFKSIVSEETLATYVSQVTDNTFDIYYSKRGSDGSVVFNFDHLYKTLLVCRMTNYWGALVLPLKFLFS